MSCGCARILTSFAFVKLSYCSCMVYIIATERDHYGGERGERAIIARVIYS